MKKFFVVFTLLGFAVMALACNGPKGDGKEIYNLLDDSVGTYKGEVIPNEECAIAVAEAIFNSMPKSNSMRNHTPQNVYFDEDNKAWIVTFCESSNSLTLGGDCSIALQKADGKVLGIWFGE